MHTITTSTARRVAKLPSTYSKRSEITYPTALGTYITVVELVSTTAGHSRVFVAREHGNPVKEITSAEYHAHIQRYADFIKPNH